jgi:hypothetical protein
MRNRPTTRPRSSASFCTRSAARPDGLQMMKKAYVLTVVSAYAFRVTA